MKIPGKFSFFVPCLMLLTSVAHSQTEAPPTKLYQHEAFQMSVPTDVAVTRKEGADFNLIYLTRDETPSDETRLKIPFMGVYVGSHPSFPTGSNTSDGSATRFKIDGLDAKFLRWQDREGRYHGETLVEIHQGWADVLHFYYGGLSQSDAAQCEAIIRSVRLNSESTQSKDKETFVPVN